MKRLVRQSSPVRACSSAVVCGPAHQSGRAGTSLVEVLMSLLVMGVGVVAVATLFPASVLRSVHATQLTQAVFSRYNAEAAIDISPSMLYDPDADGTIFNEQLPGGGLPLKNFVLDPLGYAVIGNVPLGNNQPDALKLRRFAAGRGGSETQAATYVTQPDSWVTLYEAIPSSTSSDYTPTAPAVPTTTITFATGDIPSKIDLPGLATLVQSGPSPVRLVLFDAEGRLSETRTLVYDTSTSTNPVGATSITFPKPVPNNGRYGQVSKVRVETFERRYSWLMSVRRPSAPAADGSLTAEIGVAVIFRRSLDPREEIAYSLSNAGTLNGRIQYSVSKVAGSDPDPFVKKGGFLLDTANARWYRIATVSGSSSNPQITLDRDPASSSEKVTSAVFFRGVIDVFPFSKRITP